MIFLADFLNNPDGRKRNNESEIKSKLIRAKQGDKDSRESLIAAYRPFVLKTVSNTLGTYIDIQNSEEYSIGLIAFNEAIDSYNPDKGPGFISFAEQVIKRRIIDFQRKNKKHNIVYPFSYYEMEDNTEVVVQIPDSSSARQLESIETKDEIRRFEKSLKEFGISLEELVQYSPKHKDSRMLCIKVAQRIAGNDRLYGKLSRKKNLPSSELLELISINIRTLERNRKFIIALCLILRSNLSILKEYIGNAACGGDSLD